MVKANFFKAFAAGVILYRVIRYIGQQKRLVEEFGYSLKRFKLSKVDLTSLEFVIVLGINNKSAANIKVGKIDLDVILGGIDLGRIKQGIPIKIDPYTVGDAKFRLRVPLQDLGAKAQDLLRLVYQTKDLSVELNGEFEVEAFPNTFKTIPVNFKSTVREIIL